MGWLDAAVIGLNLCPFAANSRNRDEIRFSVSLAETDEMLLADLAEECLYLQRHALIETTLVIIPEYLQAFDDFNQFLELAEGLLESMGWAGIFQFASFHPDYQFAGTEFDDHENWTNRSPYPVIHLLREQSLTHAIDNYADAGDIPLRNIERMKRLDKQAIESIFLKTGKRIGRS